MKYLKYMLALVLMVFAAGCYEVDEEIVINENGTGTFVTEMDMGQLLTLMQSVAGEDELSKEGLDKAIDTTIHLKDVMDSVKNVTPERKALLSTGTMKLQMNIAEKQFKVVMSFPFSSYSNLQQLMGGDANNMSALTEVFKQVFQADKKEEDTTQIVDVAKEPEMADIGAVFDVTVKNGLISKKINAEKYKAIKAKPEVAQMQQAAAAGIEIMYTTKIQLPRPVKNSDNPLLKLSADKKTVTFQYNLLELLDTPDKFSFTLEY